jgi:glycerol-3-phosphate O-acyltransferase / dihydroxyacetone phosphate acyltransferase
MWLLPAFSPIARIATRVYYRLRVDGGRVPSHGPALLVANHPNSLLDPALVVAVAGRPVRFLAKAPLFTDAMVGWLVRGAGSIPVYRREDDTAAMAQNAESFAAVFQALADGAAVGIFPEGLSHDEPALTPLRTGAARIALGAARQRRVQSGAAEPDATDANDAFPIVPVGLVFRDKESFRSEARVVIGAPVPWDDLVHAGEADFDAVRTLTARIDDALRAVTINLDAWEDAPLVDAADAIWAAEYGGSRNEADRLVRLRLGTGRLGELRRGGDPHWERIARDVLRHARLLDRLGLTPAALHGSAGYGEAARWTVRRLPLAAVGAIAWLGAALFWPAYRLTGILAELLKPDQNVRSTTKLLVGIPTYALWLLVLSVPAAMYGGPAAGVLTAVLLPLFGVVTLRLREQWRATRQDARRFLLKRSRRRLVDELRTRQRRIAAEIMAAVQTDSAVWGPGGYRGG